MTAPPEIMAERLRCIHVLERRMLKLGKVLQYDPMVPETRIVLEARLRELSEAAVELRKMPFEELAHV